MWVALGIRLQVMSGGNDRPLGSLESGVLVPGDITPGRLALFPSLSHLPVGKGATGDRDDDFFPIPTVRRRALRLLAVVGADQWPRALLVPRAIALLSAAADAALAPIRAALAVTVAGRPKRHGRALANVGRADRREAALPGGAVAIAAAHAPGACALARLALRVVLADGAKRQGPVRARRTAVLPRERRAADLAYGTSAVPTAHTLAGLALSRAAFRIPRARNAECQVGPGAEMPPDHWFDAAVVRGAVAVLVALAGAAEAAPGAALVVDATQGTEREVAAPDEWCTVINVSSG